MATRKKLIEGELMNCAMCPAWMGTGMVLGIVIAVLVIVLLVIVIVKTVRS
jgi:hypothetical protein